MCYVQAKGLSNANNFEDNYQDSVFGINRAFELFSADKGIPFDKYALYWVNQKIKEPFKRADLVRADENIEQNSLTKESSNGNDDVYELLMMLSEPERIVIALSFGVFNAIRKEVDNAQIKIEYKRQEAAMFNWQNQT